MWSFAYFDILSSKILLAVDRFGEKPLYYTKLSNGIFFGSTPRSVSSLSGQKLTPNHDKLSHFLVNGYKDVFKKDGCFYEGIEKLSNGSCVSIDSNLTVKNFMVVSTLTAT